MQYKNFMQVICTKFYNRNFLKIFITFTVDPQIHTIGVGQKKFVSVKLKYFNSGLKDK